MGTASQGSTAWRAGVLEAVESMESCEGERKPECKCGDLGTGPPLPALCVRKVTLRSDGPWM